MRMTQTALLLVALATITTAQATYVPNASPMSGSSGGQPFNDGASWHYAYVLDQQALGNQALKIEELAFATTATTIFRAAQFQVRMAHTTLRINGPGCFSSLMGPAPIVVHDGPLTWQTTKDRWSPIGLQTPFAYDGVRNLAIEIRFRGGPIGGQGVGIRIDPGALAMTVDPRMSADPYATDCGAHMRGYPTTALQHRALGMLFGPERVSVGSTAFFRLTGAAAANYQVAASFGQGRLAVGGRTVGLDLDPLFVTSIVAGAPVFTEYAGQFSAGGTAAASLAVPKIAALAGTTLYHAGVIYTAGIDDVMNTIATTITP